MRTLKEKFVGLGGGGSGVGASGVQGGSGNGGSGGSSGNSNVLPSKFLLGGNIHDPLNLNSLNDEKVARLGE